MMHELLQVIKNVVKSMATNCHDISIVRGEINMLKEQIESLTAKLAGLDEAVVLERGEIKVIIKELAALKAQLESFSSLDLTEAINTVDGIVGKVSNLTEDAAKPEPEPEPEPEPVPVP